ncbi:MAG: hypothetical protein LBQ87_02345 [Candidatus Fibromonas sp.]|jgi:uncharacterized protein (TIGR02145 family)|nr:hypothetical protein [Candidatus Fibromonas sp.]
MKKSLLFLLFAAVLSLLTGCGEEKVVEFGSLQQRGGVYVVPETQKPYSGKFVETHENIVIKAGSLKNGKLHGELTTYREDGSIDKVETFAEDVLNGEWKIYDENGKLRLVDHYKDGKKDGKRELYDENGKLRLVEHYKDGKIDGKRELYDENGKLIQLGSFTDSRDGKKYATIKIGSQTWMAENLNYNANGSKCYDNDESNCQEYGRLYNWNTALKACPSGWHLPSESEWEALDRAVGGEKMAGKKLKANSGWNGTDEFGFSALPGGNGDSGGSFFNVGSGGVWWSASEYNSNSAYGRSMNDNYDRAYWDINYKTRLYSVRCVEGNVDLSDIMPDGFIDGSTGGMYYEKKREQKKSEKPRKKPGAAGKPRAKSHSPSIWR